MNGLFSRNILYNKNMGICTDNISGIFNVEKWIYIFEVIVIRLEDIFFEEIRTEIEVFNLIDMQTPIHCRCFLLI